MRAVVKVKQSQGRGPSNAARYIATSKLDLVREGDKARPLFTSRGGNDLTYGDANRYLKNGRGVPSKGDLIHFSVSFHAEDFKGLGRSDPERNERLREAARWAMDELKGDLEVGDWRWVAGIHLNTKHPHIHFLIYKEITGEEGRERRLGKIPKRLLARQEPQCADGTRTAESLIGSYFVEGLDRVLERAREADRTSESEHLEERAGTRTGSDPSSSKVSAEVDLREPAVEDASQIHAIKVVNIKHHQGAGGEGEVYIGRAAPGIKGSVLGNRYRIGRDGTRQEVIEKYRRDLPWEILERGEVYRELQRLADLAQRGDLTLVCHCKEPGREVACHGDIVKSEIELINHLRSQEREAPDMDQILSLSDEFDTPLVYQEIKYRTPYNFYQAMKTAEGDLETRLKIAAATPDEARQLGEQVQARPDWPQLRHGVLQMALEHKFGPGTTWYHKLMATGDREINDGSRGNIVGRLVMDIRWESKNRPATFLDRLEGETRAQVVLEVIPAIDKMVEAGKGRGEIFEEIDKQVSGREFPEGDRIGDFLKARADGRLYSDDRLLELTRLNPSLGGRELARELILRGSNNGGAESLGPASDIRQALANRSIDDTDYRTQGEHADWLGQHSPSLRDLYEHGAEIKGSVLIIPAEEHEVPDERDPVHVIDISYAYKKIQEPRGKAEFPSLARATAEFHSLARAIAGESTDIGSEIKVSKHYFDRMEKDEAGRRLDHRDKDFKARHTAAVDRTLEEMRALAGPMARLETKESVEVAQSIAELSYAYRRIEDRKDAEHFYELGERIVGPEADLPRRVNVFNYYYSKLERDEEGHKLSPDDGTGRAAAFERTLAEMWSAVEKQEMPEIRPNDPEYVVLLEGAAVDTELVPEGVSNAPRFVSVAHTPTSFEEVGEWDHTRLGAEKEEEEEYSLPEQGTEYEVDEYDAEELDSPEHGYTPEDAYSERAADTAAWRYNAAARKAHLGGEHLRFPEGWEHEKKESVLSRTLPEIDRRIEAGDPLYNLKDEKGELVKRGIISDINKLIYPDRDKAVARTASLAGWSGRQAEPGTLTHAELLEVRGTLLELSLDERSRLECRRDLLEGYQDLTEQRTRETRVAQTYRRLSQVEGLIETLPSERLQTTAGRDSELYVSLSGEKDSLRLPVSNIRVWDAIGRLTEGAKLDLYTWKGKDGPAIINGFTASEYDERTKEAAFLKGYVHERLRDPETQLLHDNAIFREAYQSLELARTPEEVNRAADAIRNSEEFGERQRKLLFFGRAPDHYTPKMRTMRYMWWLPQKELVKALSEGRLAPSGELKELAAELYSRNSEGRVNYFFSALKNPPDQMFKPEESERLGLWSKSQELVSYERAYLLDLTWERKQSFAGRQPTLQETALRFEGPPRSSVPPSRKNESLRIYRAEVKEIERSEVESRGLVSPEEMNEIRGEACRQAWARLALPEAPANRPADAPRLLSETIVELRERVQPQAREAAQALSEFIRAKTGSDYPSDRTLGETLSRLEPADLQRLEELKKDAAARREELSRGFETIDQLRQEIAQARSEKGAERTSSITLETGVRAARAERSDPAPDLAPVMVSDHSVPARANRIDSYRQYTSYLVEIERGLISEALGQRGGVGKGGNGIAQAEGPLAREDKLKIRAIAAGLAWERIESREMVTNDPAVMKLLSLDEAIRQLRDEVQPQAREAAGKLDEFIRSRNLDRFAAEKTDYYYRADQIPKAELGKLPAADKREFAALEKHASATLREFKEGFSTIDQLRLEIEKTRNGKGDPGAQRVDGRAHNGSNGAGKGPLPQKEGGENMVTQEDSNRHPTNGSAERLANPGLGRMADRIILGNAIVARARADVASDDYRRARDHGHTFRFKIRDESLGRDRRLSQLDVIQRAEARGDRAADERGLGRGEDRRTVREEVSGADLRDHSATLNEHGLKLDRLIAELGSRAEGALRDHQHAQQLAVEVMERYQQRGESTPLPYVERETLVKTQDQTIAHGFADHTERLELLRFVLQKEHGALVRPDREAARLAAQLFVAHTELKAREERATRFDETRHLRQWEIRGERLSLAEIDRRIERASDEAQIVGRSGYHILAGERREARAEVERNGAIRDEVIEKMGERQGELRGEAGEARKLMETLSGAYQREVELRAQSGLVMPAPEFKREELERAASNIETARDETALQALSVYERLFNAYTDPKERIQSQDGWGRAPAREVMAYISHRESDARLAAFEQRGEIQPLLIETPDGRLITQRLEDTKSHSPIEQTVRWLVETREERELRHSVRQAFAQYEDRLKGDFEKTRGYLETAREIALSQADERNRLAGSQLPAPEPVFTPKQAMELEIYAERQTDPQERAHYLALARDDVQSRFDSHSQTRSHESAVAREAAHGIGRGR